MSSNGVGYHAVTGNSTSSSSPWEVSVSNLNTIVPAITTTTTSAATEQGSSHVLAYVLVPLGSIAVVAILAFIVVMIVRKNKLDKLRHHLMPLYNFDPAEEEDWESELLEGDRNRRITFRDETPSPNSPKLKFAT